MVACRDCKWCQVRPTAKCFHPKSFVELPNYYLGTTTRVPQSEQSMRSVGACGPDGDLFEPKDG